MAAFDLRGIVLQDGDSHIIGPFLRTSSGTHDARLPKPCRISVEMIHIPYKGSGPAVTDLLGGTVNMMFDNIPSALPHIKSGKLKALAATGAKVD